MTDTISVLAANLTGAALNWAVAVAEGYKSDSEQTEGDGLTVISPKGLFTSVSVRGAENGFGYRPSTNWSQLGPLIEKHQVALVAEAHDGMPGTERSLRWYADVYYDGGQQYTTEYCDTALIAACRAIVVMHLGETVQVPKELMP